MWAAAVERVSATHTAPSSENTKLQGDGDRVWSSSNPGSRVAVTPAAIGAPGPTRYTPAMSLSAKLASSWPFRKLIARESPEHEPTDVVSVVRLVDDPSDMAFSPLPVPQPAMPVVT